ncbi:MAG: hypothetical protein HY422_01215, partial [Candidatus Komeilibacteria bacterium]|nr:hypothetical protein [Candidatus Komeilibacteria bacterium]
YSLSYIIVFFLVVYAVYFFIIPLGARFARRFGFEHSIIASTIVFICYYIVFYNIAGYPWLFFVAAILYAVQKTLYWPAYHADFAFNINAREDGREIGGIDSLVLITNIAAPFLAGVILQVFGFAALFIVVSVIFLLSNLPLLSTGEVFVPQAFDYAATYKRLFARENWRRLLGYMGYGEELIALVVWPVFMMVVIGNLFNIGLIVAFATLITVFATMLIGRMSDRGDKQRVLRFGSILYALVWFVRLIVRNPWGVFAFETLSRFSKESVSVPLISLTYERAQRMKVMQTVLFFEMSLVVGKLTALVLTFALLQIWTGMAAYHAAFILAGLMTLLYMLI